MANHRYAVTVGYIYANWNAAETYGITKPNTIYFRTYDAAYRYAQRKWREYLSFTAGLDTRWGWAGYNAIQEWLTPIEKTCRPYVEVRHSDFIITMRDNRTFFET